MKGPKLSWILMVTIQLAVAVHSEIKCPSLNDGKEVTYLPHPDDCNQYYYCLNGRAFKTNCNSDLHWSVHRNRCDFPAEAKCARSLQTAESPAVRYEYEPFSGDCSKFYRHTYEIMSCPVSQHWDQLQHRCVLAGTTACQTAIATPAITVTPPATFSPKVMTTQAIFATTVEPSGVTESLKYLNDLCADGKQDYLPHPSDCHFFVHCNGIAFVQKCAANFFWNSELKTCDRQCK